MEKAQRPRWAFRFNLLSLFDIKEPTMSFILPRTQYGLF
jgi:hypothetical protein